MKEKERQFRTISLVFALLLLLAIAVCVVAILAREKVFKVSFFDDTDLLFVIIIAAILALVFLICTVVLITTDVSLAAFAKAEKKKELTRLNARREADESLIRKIE